MTSTQIADASTSDDARMQRFKLIETAKALYRAGTTQSEIGEQLGISQQSVSRILKDGDKKDVFNATISHKFDLKRIMDAVLDAMSFGGAINSRDLPPRGFRRLANAGIFRKSTIPKYYVMTDEAIEKLRPIVPFFFIRFCLFDVLQFDKLEEQEFDDELSKIKEMWKRRRAFYVPSYTSLSNHSSEQQLTSNSDKENT